MAEEAPTLAPIIPELNQLGAVRVFGLTLTVIVVGFTISAIIWVQTHREVRIVKTHQPLFLNTLFVGLLVWELAVIPLSIDDGIASQKGCNIACMSYAWLITMGATITFAALYSKLRRINKLFHNPQFRRVKVEAKDVFLPFAVLFTLNFTFMLCWTIINPLKWERQPIDDSNEWNTYGACSDTGTIGELFSALTSIVFFTVLIMVCCQAWRARRISDEFSESKKLGVVMYNWLQLTIISVPALELIDNENPRATYCLEVSVLLAQCASMLFALFLPIFLHHRRFRLQRSAGGRGIVRVTGLSEDAQRGHMGISARTSTNDGGGISSTDETNTIRTQLVSVQETNCDLRERIIELEEQNKLLQLHRERGDEEKSQKQDSLLADNHTDMEATVSEDCEEVLETRQCNGNDLEAD